MMLIPIRPEIEPMLPYPPGLPEGEVKRRYGLERVVKLASNENPLGPSPLAVAKLREADVAMSLHRYADPFELRSVIAAEHHVASERVILGNGSDEITLLVALAYLRPTDNIVTSIPEFIRYRMAADTMGAATREVPLKNWQHDVDGLLNAIDANTRAVFVASPTNPVGTMVPGGGIERLAREIPPNVLFVLDQAYHQYACDDPDYPDTAALLERHPNLMVTRTFSKAYGLAGIRLGYGVASVEVAQAIERVRPPFNVNRLAMEAAVAALGDHEHIRLSMEANAAGLQQVNDGLRAIGLEPLPSRANFVLVETPHEGRMLFEALLRRGVIVRPMGGYGMPRHLRISIGTPGENAVMLGELAAVLAAGLPTA